MTNDPLNLNWAPEFCSQECIWRSYRGGQDREQTFDAEKNFQPRSADKGSRQLAVVDIALYSGEEGPSLGTNSSTGRTVFTHWSLIGLHKPDWRLRRVQGQA